MPLINVVPSGQDQESTTVQVQDHQRAKLPRSSSESLGSLSDDFLESDMEGSILGRGRPRKIIPVIPARSEKRASRIFEAKMVEMKSLDGSKAKEVEQKIQMADPHELYLSSEEDASFSDDYDDMDSLVEFESSPEVGIEAGSPPSSRGSSRKSQEDTARVVSFVTVGRPQIINIRPTTPLKEKRPSSIRSIPQPSRDSSPLPPARRPSPLNINTTSAIQRLSISSTVSTSSTSRSSISRSQTTSAEPSTVPSHPPRKSSRLASNLSSLATTTKHAFLASDPYAKSPPSTPSTSNDHAQTPVTPKTPKTPISMAAAAWKTGFTRTLSRAKKGSMQGMQRAYTGGVIPQQNNSSRLDLSQMEAFPEVKEETNEGWKGRDRAATTPVMRERIGYEDVVNGAQKGTEAPPFALSKTKDRSMSLGMKSLARRKSIRGRDRYLG